MTNKNHNYKRVKSLREGITDVKEPAWGDNLDPDSKNYIYQRSKSYRNASGPIKNMKGRRELANAPKWKNKLATGDYTQKELGDALAAEMKDLEKIKKKLGRDFKPEELTEMLLYLNDELKKAGINLRGDIPSKAEYLAAQEVISNLFDEDIEEEDFEESTKKVREALDDRLVNLYTVVICDNERAANRGFGHDTFHNVSIKAVDDRDAMKQAWIAQNAINEGFYEGSFDEATIEDTLEFLEEDYYGSKEELDEVLNCSVEEFADIFDSDDPGFGDAIVFRVVCDTTGKTIYDSGIEEEAWEDEEDEEDFEESVKKEKILEARNPYKIYMCDNATYQRVEDFDNYYVIVPSSDIEYEVFLEALKRHVTQNCTGSIEEVNTEWDDWMKDPDELEFWSEIIEDAESIKEFLEEDDITGGAAFVFGIKKGNKLILDANFDEEMLVWKTQKAIKDREDLEESACKSSEKITESEDDDLELDSMKVNYKLYIMWKPYWSKDSKKWNRVQNSKDWVRMLVALTVERDEDSDEDDPMYIVIARNAKTGDFLASGYDAEDLIDNLYNNSEDYWDSPEYDAMDIYCDIKKLQKAIDEAKTAIEMGFGLEESTERVRESEYDDAFFAELRRRHMDQLQQILSNTSKENDEEDEEEFYINLENELIIKNIALDGTFDPEYDLEYLHISATKDEDGRIVFEAQGDNTVGYGHNYEELEKDILANVIIDKMLYSGVKIRGKVEVKKEMEKILSENK